MVVRVSRGVLSMSNLQFTLTLASYFILFIAFGAAIGWLMGGE